MFVLQTFNVLLIFFNLNGILWKKIYILKMKTMNMVRGGI